MNYLLGVDLGTSGVKTVLFDETGRCVADATEAYPLYQPQNGWAEQDSELWWDACVRTIRAVMERSGVSPHCVAGLGLSGQMHGLVMLDADGRVLGNSILWCDGRTAEECREITEAVGAQTLISITANPALPGFTAGKVLWVRKHWQEAYHKCRHILLPKDYLRFRLCGVYATDVSDASGTNLLDVPKRIWSGEVLKALDIDETVLPEVHESAEVTGYITAEAAALTGLIAGTPVVGGAGDNMAAAVGTGVVTPGKAFTTIGTSGVIFAHSDQVTIDPLGRVHTFCSAVPGAWAVMSCTLAAGGSLQWFRDQFCAAEIQAARGMEKSPYVLMDQQAAQVPIGANRLLFLPYLMGERSPLLDPDARGVFFGLSGMHTRRDLLRAVMEGVTYSLRQCLDVLRGMGVECDGMLVTGGGAASPLWRQMMADLYGCAVTTVQNGEGPALGAAILAGVGCGIYESVEKACSALIRTNSPQLPIADNSRRYERCFELYKEVYRSLAGQFKALAGLECT